MCELEKIGKVFTSKFVGTGPSSYKKRIYRAAVSQMLRNTRTTQYSVLCDSTVVTITGFHMTITLVSLMINN